MCMKSLLCGFIFSASARFGFFLIFGPVEDPLVDRGSFFYWIAFCSGFDVLVLCVFGSAHYSS